MRVGKPALIFLGGKMNKLTIKRNLDESTRKQAVWRKRQDSEEIEIFSLHITEEKEVIITDYEDYSKIYAIYSLDYYNAGN